MPGTDTQTLEWPAGLTWRKDLDYWLIHRAMDSGVTLKDETRLERILPTGNNLLVEITRKGKTQTIQSKFVIGADGATSKVRQTLYPNLKVRYSGPVRYCYQGALDLEKDFIHWFFPKLLSRPRFNVNHKDDVFLIEGAGIRELSREIVETLLPYGFDPESTPVRKDGCSIVLLYDQLLSGSFEPAKGNILLVGDAAGLILPITFEGIGTALKSGLLAAESIIESAKDNTFAAPSYIRSISNIVETIRHLYEVQGQLKEKSDAADLAASLLSAYRETLIRQQSAE